MPTPDRTTIRLATDEWIEQLRDNLVAEPPTASKPLRRVEAGSAGAEEYPRPFLVVRLVKTKTVGITSNDKLVQVTAALRLVTDVAAGDAHGAMLDAIGAIEDCLDGLIDVGVLEGAEGFDDRAWTFEYSRTSAGVRAAAAEATQTYVVKVQRGNNRVPAA